MEISDQLHCLFSATVEERGDYAPPELERA
jgi:hypothetical protein